MRSKVPVELNRTGISLSPELAAELVEGTSATRPSAEGDATLLSEVRISYAKEGLPIGSIPPLVTDGAPVRSSAKASGAAGDRMLVLVDKLGERLAFERSGTRLYDALISKLDAYGAWEGGPTRADLEQIRNEEHQHFVLLKETIEELGGDPTAVTPSANVHGVASKGLCAVLGDPRTDLMQSMEAILTAELVDNDCWENLIDLARALDQGEVAARFDEALTQEREHLAKVRHWLGVGLSRKATNKVDAMFVTREQERLQRGLSLDEADEEDAPASRPSPAAVRRPAARAASAKKKPPAAAPRAEKTKKAAKKPAKQPAKQSTKTATKKSTKTPTKPAPKPTKAKGRR